MKYLRIIILLFVVWRLFLFLPLFYGNYHIPMQKDSTMYTLLAYSHLDYPLSSYFFYPQANFDGVHYLTIAGDGRYRNVSDGRFFPFYPILIRIGATLFSQKQIFGVGQFFIAFFIANGAFLASLWLLYKLLLLDYPKKTVITTIILLLCFPTSFFFGGIYTESVFLLLSVGIFYSIRKKHLVLTAFLTLCLLITRIVGVCVVPIVLFAFFKNDYIAIFKQHKKIVWSSLLFKIGLVCVIPLGLLGFILYNQHFFSDPFFFLHAQEHVVTGRGGGIIFFPQTIVRYLKIFATVPIVSVDWWISALEFSSFCFGAMLLYYGYKKEIQKSYLVYSALAFLVPTQSGTFSGLSRYVMILFPLFLALAQTEKTWVKILYISLSLLSLFFLFALFSRGYFIA